MKITICTEARFTRTPDGAVWSEDGIRYDFWSRYLRVFERVEVVARVRQGLVTSAAARRVDGPDVSFQDLPYYVGPLEFLKSAHVLSVRLRAVLCDAEAIILRAPGNISGMALKYLQPTKRPFAVEVVGDPYDVFAPGTIRHPLRRYFRWLETRRLKKACSAALGAAYVTDHALQVRYPNTRYSTSYSSIDLADDYFVSAPRASFGEKGSFNLVFIGSLAQMYKAPDVLLLAVAGCRGQGLDVRLTLIGEGQYRARMEDLSRELGIQSAVMFTGQLDSMAVREKLIESDLFVLPSRTEGLPRAMIEAMACALPCLGTFVGGIPELLVKDDMVESGNAEALTQKICEVLTNHGRMLEMSRTNLERASHFRRNILDSRRRDFYSYIAQQTAAKLRSCEAAA